MQYPSMNRTREYTVTVPELNGGINLSVPPHRVSDNQMTEVQNLWYRNGCLQTRPAFRRVRTAGHLDDTTYRYGSVGDSGYILGFCNGETKKRHVTLVRKDGQILAHPKKLNGEIINMMLAPAKTDSEQGENVIAYVLCGDETDTGVFGVSDTGAELKKYAPHVPTVLMNGRPMADRSGGVNGVQLESYNMLTDEYICSFTSDGKNLYYYLPEAEDTIVEDGFIIKWRKDSAYVDVDLTLTFNENSKLYIGGGNVTGYQPVYDPSRGCFWFAESPPLGIPDEFNPHNAVPFPEGLDNNIVLRMKRSNTDAAKKARNTILGMRFCTWFGGAEGLAGGTRLFVGGNPDYPNVMYWSSLNNPLYFPENNCAYVGEDDKAITAFGKQSDMLVIFKDRELYYTTYAQGSTVAAEDLESQAVVDIEAVAAIFPIRQLHPETGCDCPGTIKLCNNRLVWLNSDGKVYGLFSSGIYSERNIRVLSLQIEEKIKKFPVDKLKEATATCHEQHYLLLIDGELMVMDFSSYGFNYYGSFSSDEKAQKNVTWYIWKTEANLCALISAGSSAILISADEDDKYRHTFVLDESETEDDNPRYPEVSKVKIDSILQTKLYDFGSIERMKRVNTVYLHANGDKGVMVNVGYVDDEGNCVNRDRLTLTGRPLEATAPCRLKPNRVRIRHFGMRLTASGRIRVGEISLTYSMMGVVR